MKDRAGGFVIVVTGFGPFKSHLENPSEVLTRRLAEQGLDTSEACTLITEVIPVTYNDVNQTVSKLWKSYNPDVSNSVLGYKKPYTFGILPSSELYEIVSVLQLMIHIGVHPIPKVINLEQQSFKRGYESYDMNAQLPAGQVCPQCGECGDVDILISSLDCAKIAEAVSDKLPGDVLECKVSYDPGRYLCAYSYFFSLSYDKDRTLFIHVPDFDEQATEDVIFDSLKMIIKQCLIQIKKK